MNKWYLKCLIWFKLDPNMQSINISSWYLNLVSSDSFHVVFQALLPPLPLCCLDLPAPPLPPLPLLPSLCSSSTSPTSPSSATSPPSRQPTPDDPLPPPSPPLAPCNQDSCNTRPGGGKGWMEFLILWHPSHQNAEMVWVVRADTSLNPSCLKNVLLV